MLPEAQVTWTDSRELSLCQAGLGCGPARSRSSHAGAPGGNPDPPGSYLSARPRGSPGWNNPSPGTPTQGSGVHARPPHWPPQEAPGSLVSFATSASVGVAQLSRPLCQRRPRGWGAGPSPGSVCLSAGPSVSSPLPPRFQLRSSQQRSPFSSWPPSTAPGAACTPSGVPRARARVWGALLPGAASCEHRDRGEFRV